MVNKVMQENSKSGNRVFTLIIGGILVTRMEWIFTLVLVWDISPWYWYEIFHPGIFHPGIGMTLVLV